MKPKFKFELVDILLSVFLIIAISVNIWAYWPKRVPSPGPASGQVETLPNSKPEESGNESKEPDSNSREEKPAVLSSANLEGTWNADLIYYSDTKQELPYAYYELIFTFKHKAENDYHVEITTAKSRYADSDLNPDVPPEGFAPSLITDNTFARLEQDEILYFSFSFEPENIFKVSLQKENGNIIGRAYQAPETGLPEDQMCAYLELKKGS